MTYLLLLVILLGGTRYELRSTGAYADVAACEAAGKSLEAAWLSPAMPAVDVTMLDGQAKAALDTKPAESVQWVCLAQTAPPRTAGR